MQERQLKEKRGGYVQMHLRLPEAFGNAVEGAGGLLRGAWRTALGYGGLSKTEGLHMKLYIRTSLGTDNSQHVASLDTYIFSGTAQEMRQLAANFALDYQLNGGQPQEGANHASTQIPADAPAHP